MDVVTTTDWAGNEVTVDLDEVRAEVRRAYTELPNARARRDSAKIEIYEVLKKHDLFDEKLMGEITHYLSEATGIGSLIDILEDARYTIGESEVWRIEDEVETDRPYAWNTLRRHDNGQ